MKGIKKGKEKSSDAQKEKETAPNEAPILMVHWGGPSQKRKEVEKELHTVGEITFPSIADQPPSDQPVVIKVLISNREVNRAYMD